MKLFISIFLVLLSFSSCTYTVETHPIQTNGFLSDGNSKVWLVDHLYAEGKDFQQPSFFEKDVMIFYVSGKCKVLKFKDFGSASSDDYSYSVKYQQEKIYLNLKRKNKFWKFEVTTSSNDTYYLNPVDKFAFKYKMEIIPLPEW
jgi:hypothetical protein